MFSTLGENMKKLRWAVPLLALSVAACELDVADPDVITVDELAGPSSVPTTINGVIGDLATATEHYSLYASLFTDEMILAGTFPTRVQVDERRVVFSNSSVTDEVEENLQVARSQARKMVESFNGFLGDDEFDQGDLAEGIAIGHYVQGLMKLQLGALYCQTPIEGGGSPVSSEAAVSAALADFQAAQTAAEDAGLTEWADAARVGQARAHLYLGSATGDATHFDDAATVASAVDRAHRLEAEFSSNDPEQFNKVFDLTWGSQNEVIRWTVGDGTQGERLNEKFAEYDEFAALGIINPSPDPQVFEAFNSSIAVHLQEIYNEDSDNILISSGIHARLIEAEAEIRNGNTGPAEDIINDVRADWDQRWTAHRFRVDTTLNDIALTGDTQQDLLTLMGEYARETWLSGTRQENLRRLVEEYGAGTAMDLYPEKPGDQICFPVSEQEETGASP